MKMIITPNKFALLIEETVKNKKMSYMDAILWYCEKNGIDPSDSRKLVNKGLKEKLTYEAQSLNLLKEKVAQLPVQMNGFEIYKVYLAVKLHFTSKNRSYDFHRHGGRTTAKLETFTKRRDRYFFHKLSRTYNSTTVVDYFVSNFVNNSNLWVGDIIGSTGDESYKEWSKRLESLHYYYEQDIDYILERMTANEIEFDDIFTSHDGQHPPILKMVLSKKICVETFVILEDILSFANRLDKDILETVLWPKMHDRMARYKPFLKYDTPRYKITLRKKVKEI